MGSRGTEASAVTGQVANGQRVQRQRLAGDELRAYTRVRPIILEGPGAVGEQAAQVGRGALAVLEDRGTVAGGDDVDGQAAIGVALERDELRPTELAVAASVQRGDERSQDGQR